MFTAWISNGVINGYRVHAHKVGEKLSDGDLDYGLYDSDNGVLEPTKYHWLQYAYTVKGRLSERLTTHISTLTQRIPTEFSKE